MKYNIFLSSLVQTLFLPLLVLLPGIFQTDHISHHYTEYVLKGFIVDAGTAEPIIFCTVTVPGAGISVVTDYNGQFALKAPQPIDTIEVVYVGYKSAIVDVRGKDEIIVRLEPAIILDEVVLYENEHIPDEAINIRPASAKHRDMSVVGSRTQAQGYYVDGLRTSGITGGVIGQPDAQQHWNTEDYDVINEQRFLDPLTSPLSTFSIDVDGASYSNLRRFLTNGQIPPKDAVRIEEMVNYFDYAYEAPTGNTPFSIHTESAAAPWNSDHRLVHIGLQGKTLEMEDLPPSNLTFLIDVSGSMRSMNKLPLLKSAFRMLVEQLRPEDKVSIAVYASATGLVLPPTSGDNKAEILKAIDALEAGGSTAGAQGIQLAYETARKYLVKEGNNRVILATDGDFNVGVSSDAELVRLIEKERESGIFLTVLGFGVGNYKDNKMQKLANAGNGQHAYIDNINEAKKMFIHEFGGTMYTIAKDVKIQVEFNPAVVQAYRLIGYENRMLQAEDFRDDKKDAGEIGSGHTVTALYEIIPQGVKSEFIGSVDPLKFQESTRLDGKSDKELMFVKVRYKDPDGKTSKLIERPVRNDNVDISYTTESYRWSAAVAVFGMLLRDSEFKGNADNRLVLSLARGAAGKDPYGYRAEFIRLVESVDVLARVED